MYWNHRVMIRHCEWSDETSLGIREVYYDEDGTVDGWTADDMEPHGDTLEELRADLLRMLACLDRPVLDERVEESRAERRRTKDTR